MGKLSVKYIEMIFINMPSKNKKLVEILDKIEDKLNTIMLFKGCTYLNANVKLLLDSLIVKLERR